MTHLHLHTVFGQQCGKRGSLGAHLPLKPGTQRRSPSLGELILGGWNGLLLHDWSTHLRQPAHGVVTPTRRRVVAFPSACEGLRGEAGRDPPNAGAPHLMSRRPGYDRAERGSKGRASRHDE